MAVRERFIAAMDRRARKIGPAHESCQGNHLSKRWQKQAFCEQSAMTTVGIVFAVIDAYPPLLTRSIGHNNRYGATNCWVKVSEYGESVSCGSV
jgi:hypothetical protein